MRRQTRRKCTKCALGLQELLIYPRSLFTRSGRDPSGTSLPHEGFLRHLWTNDALADETAGSSWAGANQWPLMKLQCPHSPGDLSYPFSSAEHQVKKRKISKPNELTRLSRDRMRQKKKIHGISPLMAQVLGQLPPFSTLFKSSPEGGVDVHSEPSSHTHPGLSEKQQLLHFQTKKSREHFQDL